MSSDDSQHATPPVRLGAYAARSCAVRAQWDVVGPCEPEPDTPFRAGLARDGIAFEADVVAELVAREPDAVVIDPHLPTAEREARTLAALAAGARLIVGPRLPHDPVSGRVGAPDLLVRRDSAAATGAPAYAPIDIKNHRTDEDGSYDSARGDLLQLAHYHRMLETLGHAATAATAASQAAPATGAIIGNDRRELWFDLAAPRFTGFSALDLYDTEYAERVRVARAAAAHVADPSLPLARTPVWFGECSGCPWRTHCGALLAERLDVSLLPGVGLADHEALARVGADTMPALAALPDGTRVDGISDGGLVDAIAQARTRLSPDVAHRRPGVAHVTVERADIELDVDMENVADGAYLWGVHVTDRTGAATGTGAGGAAGAGLATPGYHAFVDWDADAGVAGARAFAAFWAWLSELRAACDARGLTLRAYCWHEAAENGWLRRGAEATGVDADDVERFIGSEQWVDLLKVFRRQVITGYGNGLKVVAPLLGFAWADEDPSGGSSMLRWRDAVDPDVTPAAREAARARLLAYNADDVRATLHVREWLDREGPALREVPRGAARG